MHRACTGLPEAQPTCGGAGQKQPSPCLPTSLPALGAVMPTAYSAHFGDLRGRKGSAERQTRRRGWHLSEPNGVLSLPFMLRSNPQECMGCLTFGSPLCVQVYFHQFSRFYHSFSVFALSLKSSSRTQVVSIKFMLKFPVRSYKGITIHSLSSSKGLTIPWKIFSVLTSCDR